MSGRDEAKQAIKGYIEKIIDQHFLKPLTGKVVSKMETTDPPDMEIKVFGLLEQGEAPTFRWSDGIFARLDDFWLEVGDDLFIIPINGTFVITGRITKVFPKLRDTFDITTSPVVILEKLVDSNIVGFELESEQTLNNPRREDVQKTISWYAKFGDLPSETRLSLETQDEHNYETGFTLSNSAPPVPDSTAGGGTHAQSSGSGGHEHNLSAHKHEDKKSYNQQLRSVIITKTENSISLALTHGSGVARPFKDNYYN